MFCHEGHCDCVKDVPRVGVLHRGPRVPVLAPPTAAARGVPWRAHQEEEARTHGVFGHVSVSLGVPRGEGPPLLENPSGVEGEVPEGRRLALPLGLLRGPSSACV